MKPLALGIFVMLFLTTKAQPVKQALDSATTARLSIEGFCLCKTTMTELTQTANDFKEVTVEEMDTPKNCYAQDSRYTNGMGIYSEKYPGMIFQKGNFEDYVGKIRLTKDFKGNLPDGSPVDLKTLTLRKVFALYPALTDSWGSRGCSDYWHFSDKTISFYVKIDKNIQPQFPINEAHYLDKPIEGIDLVASCFGLREAVERKTVQLESPEDPVFFIDSIRTNKKFLSNVEPNEIAMLQVIKDADIVKAAGFEGRKGIIYIFTKSYARQRYWEVFSARSAAYSKAVPSPTEKGIVYILNGKVLGDTMESDLLAAAGKSPEITIIKARQLKKDHNITGWKLGVVITTSN